jgi:hypothetical protein
MRTRREGLIGLALVALVGQVGCSRQSDTKAAAPAPADGAADSVVTRRDTVPSRTDTTGTRPDTTRARRVPVRIPSDTPPASERGASPGFRVSPVDYEGWRQYSVNCARCHGQDVLPNPVAANLLISLAPGGPMNSEQAFTQVVSEGSQHRGMPAFNGIMTAEQIAATYAYVKGRAEKRIPPGRPERPS